MDPIYTKLQQGWSDYMAYQQPRLIKTFTKFHPPDVWGNAPKNEYFFKRAGSRKTPRKHLSSQFEDPTTSMYSIFTYIYHKNQPFQIFMGNLKMMEHSSRKLWSWQTAAAVVALADLTRLEEKMNTPEVRAYFVPWQMSDKRDARICKIHVIIGVAFNAR